MDPAFVVDLGHCDVKSGVTWLGKAPSAKAARLAAANGDSHVVSCRSMGITDSCITDPDAVTQLLQYACANAHAAATSSGSARVVGPSTDHLQGATMTLLTPVDMCRADLETLAAIAFEGLGVRRFHVACSSAAGLMGSGITSGIALDAGHMVSRVVPVLDGLPVGGGAWRIIGRGGWHQSGELRALLLESGMKSVAYATVEAEIDALHRAKVSAPWSMSGAGLVDTRSMTVTLPDGEAAQVEVPGAQLDRIASSLYDVRGARGPAGQAAPTSTSLCDALLICLRHEGLPGTVPEQLVSFGGPSAIPGSGQFIEETLKRWRVSAKLKPVRDTVHLPWAGASILTQLGSFAAICVDKNGYDRDGPAIVRSCLA